MTKKVLVVDDDRVIRTLIARAVEKMGLVAIEASNGKVAWLLLKDNPDIALVVTDHMMPGMSGKQLTQRIRRSKRLGEIPVLMISGYVRLGEISALLDLGVTRFMVKPIDPTILKHYLELLILKRTKAKPQLVHH